VPPRNAPKREPPQTVVMAGLDPAILLDPRVRPADDDAASNRNNQKRVSRAFAAPYRSPIFLRQMPGRLKWTRSSPNF
jgi:hypothetical protein